MPGIADERVLGAIDRRRASASCSPTFAERAWENIALPIAFGQTISQPLVVALMTEALEVGPRMKVLEIGTGSGYQAAVLAQAGRRVYTIERHQACCPRGRARASTALRPLQRRARRRRRQQGLAGPGAVRPHHRHRRRRPSVPQALIDQLAPDGILVLPVGPEFHDQRLVRIRRRELDYEMEALAWVRFVPMVAGLPRPGGPLTGTVEGGDLGGR